MRSPFAAYQPLLWCLAATVFFGCEYTPASPEGRTIPYTVDEETCEVAGSHVRYELIWPGEGQYTVADAGAVRPSKSFAIRFDVPDTSIVTRSTPKEILGFNFHYLPEPEMRRPRVVVFDDINDNQRFDLAVDRLVAMDGSGYDSHVAISAFADLDGFLSQLTLEEHNIYYGWTDERYTPFIYTAASRHWSPTVYPLFENAYVDGETSEDTTPVVVLSCDPEPVMKTDFRCNRQVERVVKGSQVQTWVDQKLDVLSICAASDIPCGGFDGAAGPDLDELFDQSDVFTTSCAWSAGVETLAVHQGYAECEDCTCTTVWFSTLYYIHEDNMSPWMDCPEGTLPPFTPY